LAFGHVHISATHKVPGSSYWQSSVSSHETSTPSVTLHVLAPPSATIAANTAIHVSHAVFLLNPPNRDA
jgi:hypothetical protein